MTISRRRRARGAGVLPADPERGRTRSELEPDAGGSAPKSAAVAATITGAASRCSSACCGPMAGFWTTTGRRHCASSITCRVRSACRRCCSSTGPGADQTEREQAPRIRRYLGLREFRRQRRGPPQGLATRGRSRRTQRRRAAGAGRRPIAAWRIVLPAPRTLERIVSSEVARATADLFETIAGQLPDRLRGAIDLLGRSAGGRRALQPVPPQGLSKSATAGVIKGDIVRLHLIEELLADGADLGEIDAKIIRQLGQLGRRYDAAISGASPSRSATHWSPAT